MTNILDIIFVIDRLMAGVNDIRSHGINNAAKLVISLLKP